MIFLFFQINASFAQPQDAYSDCINPCAANRAGCHTLCPAWGWSPVSHWSPSVSLHFTFSNFTGEEYWGYKFRIAGSNDWYYGSAWLESGGNFRIDGQFSKCTQYDFQFTCYGYNDDKYGDEVKAIFDRGEHTCIFFNPGACEPPICDFNEPNNTFETATPIVMNQPITWQGNYAGDVDCFSFIATVPYINAGAYYNSSYQLVPWTSYYNVYNMDNPNCHTNSKLNIGEKYYLKFEPNTWQCFNYSPHFLFTESLLRPMEVSSSGGSCNPFTGNYLATLEASYYPDATYYWTIEDIYGTHETETNYNILNWDVPQGTGQLNVSVYSLGACTDQTTVSTVVTIPHCEGTSYLRGSGSNKQVNALKVFTHPNPASDNITFDLSTIKGKIESLEIYDQLGKVVYKENLEGSDFKKVISLKDFNAGLCYYLVKHEEGIASGKFFVSK